MSGRDIAQLGTIGFAVGQFQPATELDAFVRGKGEAAAKGALAGAGGCVVFLSVPLFGVYTPVFALMCMPVAAAGVAIAAGSQAASADAIDAAESSLKSGLAELRIQESIGNALGQYAQESGLRTVILPAEQGPATPDEPPRYAANASGVDTVLEVSAVELTAKSSGTQQLPVRFEISARVRLVRVRDNEVLDGFTYNYHSLYRTLDEWSSENGRLIAEELGRAHREIAEQVIDELLLIYHAPVPGGAPRRPATADQGSAGSTSDGDSNWRVPPYALRPIYPEVFTTAFSRQIGFGGLGLVMVDGIQPTLRWEAFPRPHDLPSGTAAASRVSDVSYELRLYRSRPFVEVPLLTKVLSAETEIYSRTGLIDPYHRVEANLDHCAVYFWTVRARFRLDGVPRVTEWTGAYSRYLYLASFPLLLPVTKITIEPWWWRRSDFPAYAVLKSHNKLYYLPFQTPAKEGVHCPLS